MDNKKRANTAGQGPIAMGSGSQAMPGGMPNMAPGMAPMNPKPSMDPAKKKKIITGVCVGVGAVVAAIVAVVVIALVTRVDYSESYKVAKELKTKVYNIYQDYDCEYAAEYAKSAYVSEKTYNGYVEGCKTVSDGAEDLVAKLGETAGVKKDKEIKAAFEAFQKSLTEVMPDQAELEESLKIYEAWHRFIVLKDDLRGTSAESEVRTAANALINSGNETLKTYGEGWLTVTLAYTQAYQAYYNASYSDPNKSELRTEMNNKQTEQKNWVAANQPDVAEMGKISSASKTTMYNDYTKLYNLIRDTYADNYDDSGECSELFGVVYCE